MKRKIITGLFFSLLACGHVVAQNSNRFVDDVYYTGSQAQQDAQKENQQKGNASNFEPHRSTAQYDTQEDYYSNSEYSYLDDDSYIDYDDDSYTSRIRRFNYPMMNVGYWGSLYSPYWYDPFFVNPYYGWGNWYTPRYGVAFNMGYGPYWHSGWGMNTWYGYGHFGHWGGGYSYLNGYNHGYWNGYYTGIYDRGRYSGVNNRVTHYAPRGARLNNNSSIGNYGRNRTIPGNNSNRNTVRTESFRIRENNNRQQSERIGQGERGSMRLQERGINNTRQRGEIRNNNSIESNNNRGRGAYRQQNNSIQRTERNSNPSRVTPQRDNNSYRSTTPSRSSSGSYNRSSSPSPSRSSGGSIGAGSRSGGRR